MDEKEREETFQRLNEKFEREERARHEAYHRNWKPGMPMYCYSELSERLVEALPELEDRYRLYLDAWSPDTMGGYIAYGDVLQPYVIMLLDSGGPSESVDRVFAFVEELASHPDEHVSTLCQLEICEPIFGVRLLGGRGHSWARSLANCASTN